MPARVASQRQKSARAVYLRGAGRRLQVRLLQRPAVATLMAGMWELPVYEPTEADELAFTVRHAITVTNHVVDVYTPKVRAGSVREDETWVGVADLHRYALTGLTRKVLRRIGCLRDPESVAP